MPGRSRRLNQLDQELLALGEQAMMIEEFDGFVAGLLVCPDLISPNDWLPIVWNRENDPRSPFDDIDHTNRVFGLIMDHYNNVVLTLMRRPERYRPLFPVDRSEVLWEVWIEGFAEAVNLRPSAWQKLLDADPDTAEAALGILTLVEVANRNKDVPAELADKLTESAPDLIPDWVVTLNNWRIANSKPASVIELTPGPQPASRGKVGRNEPCPCGSGKKYKRCCGLN